MDPELASIQKGKSDAQRVYREGVRNFINGLKSFPCDDCKQTFIPEAMDFDHVRGEKKFNISSAMKRRSLKEVLEEVAKCDLVCATCHRIRTFNRRQK